MLEKELFQEGLYFVHGYYGKEEKEDIREDGEKPENEENSKEDFYNRIILTKESLDDLYAIEGYDLDVSEIRLEERPQEGSFLYVDKNHFRTFNGNCFLMWRGGWFPKADHSSDVLVYREINRQLVEAVNRRNYGNRPLELSGRITDVCSYHVNIGHGNCSVIAFREDGKGKVWMVDCSVFDFMNRKNQEENLDACLKQIKTDFQTDKISKLLITHLHFDHIGGIQHLIEKGWLDQDTEVWMNTRYPWEQKAYTRILSQLSVQKVRIIDPIVSNSTQHIKVLYPVVSFNQCNHAPGKHINNASVLYQICLGNENMLFSGDIETEGWEAVRCCRQHLNRATYYCISHHGSITGHYWMRDPEVGGKGKSVVQCMQNLKMAVLMGRDGAYRNIFDKQVLADFYNEGKRIVKTEDAEKYVKLEWRTGMVSLI